ncbi:MAG TPA: hypothetical protein VK155_07430 [Bacteroidales bacterium]|jgi:hypothetical protein|nr:hypothetical protein [Bacteroidales bacterium]
MVIKNVLVISLIFFVFHSGEIYAQEKNLKISGGYFGETITYPGFTISAEREKVFSGKAGISTSLELGYYHHPRNHDSWFIGINHGFRQYFGKNFFAEQYLGIGTIADFFNEDVWHIDDNGNAVRVSKFGNFNFMPSVILGTGYRSGKYAFWLRPRIYWQLPYNNLALPHFALQAGFSFTLNKHVKDN